MKIAFIFPNMNDRKSFGAMQPLVFSILAALTPKDVEVVLYDERVEKIPLDINADLVAISVQTFTARRAYQIASEFRKRNIPVVMGGYHPTFMPEEAGEHADSVILGDGELIWTTVVEDAKNKCLKKIYGKNNPASLEGLHYDRSIFNGKKYTPLYPVQYGRGCKFACDFCSINAFYGKNLRQRPVNEVVEEIRSLHRRNILIVDDNVFVNVEKAKELFEALIPLKIRWVCQTSIDVVNSDELLQLMRKSGCMNLFIGFESLDPRNLEQMNKKANISNSRYSDIIRKIGHYGITVFGSFIIGYDHDTKESFDTALEFALENKFCLVNFNPLMPMPGTKLYQRLKNEGRLLYDKWWLEPEFRYGNAMFIPKQMTPQELEEGCRNIMKKFYRYSSILKRATDFSANSRGIENFFGYLLGNLITRKEAYAKIGGLLGGSNDRGGTY